MTTMELHATIPANISFADLHLSRDTENGSVVFQLEPLELICEASGLDLDELLDSEEPIVPALIQAWYQVHLERGGEPDAVQEDLLEEMRLEQELGGGFSHAPGHA